MAKYPVFLNLEDRSVIVIGGGGVALRKVQTLLPTGAKLLVVAKRVEDELTALCQNQGAKLINSEYCKDHLAGAVLAIAATNDNELNKQIYADCHESGVLCNVVDVPELCDFYVPAIVKRGDLQIAISTNGRCPAYAALLRKKLEKDFTDKHGQFLIELDTLRKYIIANVTDIDQRKTLLQELAQDSSFEYFTQNGSAKWRTFAEEIIKNKTS
ncbi:MAG: precorrin-2 dehydrogenase/sirohydrochlorin ferrochelatase family protein [Planctomycetota bacterium]|jgi:precorrin-2 dehydrogenase/sirohydrochlorin ferrochelatase